MGGYVKKWPDCLMGISGPSGFKYSVFYVEPLVNGQCI